MKLKHVFALLEVAGKEPVVFWAEVYGQAPATLGVEEMREVAREEIERWDITFEDRWCGAQMRVLS